MIELFQVIFMMVTNQLLELNYTIVMYVTIESYIFQGQRFTYVHIAVDFN